MNKTKSIKPYSILFSLYILPTTILWLLMIAFMNSPLTYAQYSLSFIILLISWSMLSTTILFCQNGALYDKIFMKNNNTQVSKHKDLNNIHIVLDFMH